VLLDENGTPFVADFGIAKDDRNRSLTQSGVAIGSYSLMAPEQIDSRQGVDRRSDVYALGGILYVIFAGRTPFSGPTATLLKRIVNEAPEPLRALRGDVDPRI